MSTSLVFNGTTYSVPASGETGWSSLSAFLIDVGNNAQTTSAQKGTIRIATSTPVTVSSTDFTVLSNLSVAGAVAFTLPAGIDKTIYVIGDTKGDAQTNNVTITPASGNINGSSTYVIKNNYGVVALQYSSAASEWKVVNRYFTKIDAANEVYGILSAANGGTGIANNVAATTTRVGNYALTQTLTAITSVTYPTTGTLATLAGVEVLTNKTLSGNTATNFISGSGTLTLNTTGTITVPNATDTLVGKATTDILTNKTLSGNTATNLISGSGTLTLNTTGTVTVPNATDTLVGKATTDVLTNKTLTGNVAVTLVSGAATITLPVVTGTLATLAGTEVLTNKTLSGNTAVTLISGSGTLTLNTTGTITVPSATDTLVGKATSDVLTNKTLTGNIAVNLVSGAATVTLPTTTSTLATLGLAETFTGAKTFGSAGAVGKLIVAGTTSGSTIIDATAVASGTLTLPAATDTLVGKATTDTLTNKTLTGNVAVTLVSGAATVTLPTTTSTLATIALAETLTSKTLTSPNINTAIVLKAAAELRLNNAGDTFYTGFKGGNAAANKIWTLPLVDGSANQILATDGSGTLQWATGLSSSLNQYNVSVGNSSNVATSTDTSLLGDIKSDPISAAFTVTIASPCVATLTAHGLVTGDRVYATTSGALPTGLTASTTYFVIKIDANTFNLATSQVNALTNTKINTSGSQSGTHTLFYGGMKFRNPNLIIPWTSWTPTGSWTSNVTYTGFWRRVGDTAEYQARIACTGAPTTANLTINVNSGQTPDTTKLLGSASDVIVLGKGSCQDDVGAVYGCYIAYNSVSSYRVMRARADGIDERIEGTISQAVHLLLGTLIALF